VQWYFRAARQQSAKSACQLGLAKAVLAVTSELSIGATLVLRAISVAL